MKTLDQLLAEWDAEVEAEEAAKDLGSPRFVLKHALRLQGLFLNDDNEITNASGKLYAWLGEAAWEDKNTLKAMIKRVGTVDFAKVTIDVDKLRK